MSDFSERDLELAREWVGNLGYASLAALLARVRREEREALKEQIRLLTENRDELRRRLKEMCDAIEDLGESVSAVFIRKKD